MKRFKDRKTFIARATDAELFEEIEEYGIQNIPTVLAHYHVRTMKGGD